MMKLHTILLASVGLLLGLFLVTDSPHFASAALQILTGPQGGTGIGTTTAGDIGNCLKVSTVGPLIWTIGTCGSGSGGYPFTPTINYGTAAQATTGIPWFQNGFEASTTSYIQYATSTALTVTGTGYFGSGGSGSAIVQYGPTGYEWTTGYDTANNTYEISSSTTLGTSNALSISKTNLVLTFAYASTTVVTFTTASTTNLTVSSAGGTPGCATFSAIGLISNTGTACGTGAGGTFPFTVTTNFGNGASASTTQIWAQTPTNGIVSFSASSTSEFDNSTTTFATVNNTLWLTNLSAGGLGIDANHKVYSGATSTLSTISGTLAISQIANQNANTVLGNFTGGSAAVLANSTTSIYAGTDGQVLTHLNGGWTGAATTTYSGSGGVTTAFANGALTITCTAAGSGATGCLSSTDWSTFNSKQATIAATWPIILTGATLSFGGLSTTTGLTQGQIPYVTGVNTFGQVATGSVSGSGLVAATAGQSVIGSGLTISLSNINANTVVGNNTGAAAAPTSFSTTSIYAGTAGQALTMLNGGWTGAATTTDSCSTGITCTFSGTAESFSIGANALTLSMFPTQANGTVLANGSGATAVPSAISTTTLYGALGTPGQVLMSSNGIAVWAATSTSGSGSTFPFSVTTNFGNTANATTTQVWHQTPTSGIISLSASSTSEFDNSTTTLATIKTSLWLPSITTKSLAVDSNGLVYGSATGTIAASTGISLSNPAAYSLNQGTTITNTGVISGSCSGGTTCSGTNPLTINSFSYDWAPATNYAVNNNSTTTVIWDKLGVNASSTSNFDQINVGSTTASSQMATSTFFGNLSIRNNASTTNLFVSSLVSGNCVQASTAGLVTTAANPCGTVTSVATNNGLTGGTITGAGTIGLATIAQGVLGNNGSAAAVPTSLSTTTGLYSGTAGQTLTMANGGWIGVATTTDSCGTGLTCSFSGTVESFSLSTPVSIANGGTNATSFGTSNGVVYYDGTRLVNSANLTFNGTNLIATKANYIGWGDTNDSIQVADNPTWLAAQQNVTTLSAFGNNSGGAIAFRESSSGNARFVDLLYAGMAGFGTSSPQWVLEVASSTAPQFALSDGVNADNEWVMRNAGGNFYIATSSPSTFATSSQSVFSILSGAAGANATTTFLGTDFTLKQGSQTAFNINDTYGTNIFRVGTASTTGPQFAIFATTTAASSCGGQGETCIFSVDQYGHVAASSTVPVLTSCGTSPSLSADSNDWYGTITVGSVAATACTLTFGAAHTIGTHCVISEQTGSVVNASTYTESLTGFTYSQTGLTSDKLDYICSGQ